MGLIKVYDEVTPDVSSNLLTQEDAIAAFDLFIQGKTIGEVKLLLCLDQNKLKTLYTRLKEVVDMMERILRREAWLERPIPAVTHIDEETGEVVIDTPATEGELCPVPSTLAKLKERSLELINNDYNISEPLFATDDVMELVDGLYYVIDQVIINSKSTKDGTFAWYKEQVIG